MDKERILKDRRFAARLIFGVLTERIIVREALLKFPPDTKDLSLHAAYHALAHYEADEDFRLRDPLYKEEQDDFLTLVAQKLEKGEDLPDNIIRSYEKYYSDINPPREKGLKGLIKSLCKFLNV